MKLPNTSSKNKKGFTLLEVLVVIAVFIMITSLGLFVSMDSYRGVSARSERDVVVSLLQMARSRAMNNMHQAVWGVCYSPPNYVLFLGSTCEPGAATSELVAASPAATIAGLSGVVFSQLAGTTTGATVTITQNVRVSAITVNHEGTILW